MRELKILAKENDFLIEDLNILVKESAIKQFLKVAQEENILGDVLVRIGVKGGGCSGFMQTLDFISKTDIDEEEDILYKAEFEDRSLSFVIDIFSSEYLKGAEVDYISTLTESGFKFSIAKATRSCGCGKSFAV